MPVFAAMVATLFTALGGFMLKMFAAKVAIRVAAVAAITLFGTALLATFNFQVAPLMAQAFNTQYGQVIGLALAGLVGTERKGTEERAEGHLAHEVLRDHQDADFGNFAGLGQDEALGLLHFPLAVVLDAAADLVELEDLEDRLHRCSRWGARWGRGVRWTTRFAYLIVLSRSQANLLATSRSVNMLSEVLSTLTTEQRAALRDRGISDQLRCDILKGRRLPTELHVADIAKVTGAEWVELQREVTVMRAPEDRRQEVAEAVGFEPTEGSPLRQFSRLLPSTARPRFQRV